MKPIQHKVCMLCNSSEVNELELGEFHSSGTISVHYFCLLLTSGLEQNGNVDRGIFGFLPKDIRAEVERIKRLKCAYCKKLKANVGCCVEKCRHTFHTNCGLTHGCLQQFVDPYRSFCHRHVTQGTGTGRGARAAPHKPTEMCTICYDQMGAYSDVNSVQSPCCKNSWFHRRCLMKLAKNAGYFFKCPMCNNEDDFRQAVKLRGVFVPDRDAAWELEPNAFAELLERPETCEAAECVCPLGRDHESSTYKMLRCVLCGSHCVHNTCLTTTTGSGQFTCASCDIVGPPAVAAVVDESDVVVKSVRDMKNASVSQSDKNNAGHGRSESGSENNDDTLRPPSMDDGLSTTVEADNKSGVVCESDEQTVSQKSSGKGDYANDEPLGQSSADSGAASKDNNADTTAEMDTKTSDDDKVATTKDDNADTTTEMDTKTKQIMSQKFSGKGDHDNDEPLGQSSADSGAASKDNNADTTTEMDTTTSNDDDPVATTKDDNADTTTEMDTKTKQIMSQKSGGKGDHANDEPLGQSSSDSGAASKDNNADTTAVMDTTTSNDDDPVATTKDDNADIAAVMDTTTSDDNGPVVAAPVRTIDSNMSDNEAMIIETTKETKQKRSLVDSERADCVATPQSKRIRRALETMKKQSKITSYFRTLGAGDGQSGVC